MGDRTGQRDLSSTLAIRTELFESVLVAVMIALGVNLAASGLLMGANGGGALTIGVLVCFISLAWLLHVRLRPVTNRTKVGAVLVVDSASGDILTIPDYWFGTTVPGYAEAAFTEMPALKKQWDSHAKAARSQGESIWPRIDQKIGKELAQFFTIEQLAITLRDYYDHLDPSVTAHDPLVTYKRAELPHFLLENRLLELFSRDIKDRTGFGEKDDEANGEVYVIFGTHYFSRFELIMPRSCTVRLRDGIIVFSGPNLEVEILVTCSGLNKYVPFAFLRHVMGVGDVRDIDAFSLDISVTTRLKRRLFFGKRQDLRDRWVTKFVDKLKSSADWEHHLDRINWPQIEAMLTIWPPGGGFSDGARWIQQSPLAEDEVSGDANTSHVAATGVPEETKGDGQIGD